MTFVFDISNWSDEYFHDMVSESSYIAWGHVPYERDSLKEQLASKEQCSYCGSTCIKDTEDETI